MKKKPETKKKKRNKKNKNQVKNRINNKYECVLILILTFVSKIKTNFSSKTNDEWNFEKKKKECETPKVDNICACAMVWTMNQSIAD